MGNTLNCFAKAKGSAGILQTLRITFDSLPMLANRNYKTKYLNKTEL